MKKNQQGFSVVETFIVLVVIGVVGFAGWTVWKRQDKEPAPKTTNNNSSQQQQEEETDPQSVGTAKLPIEDLVIFPGSTDDEARHVGSRIKSFYTLVVKSSLDKDFCVLKGEGARTVCEQFKAYLTDNAIKQLEAPSSSSLLACGQMKILIYSIDAPKLSGTTGTATVRYLQYGEPLQNASTGVLSLKRVGDPWQIDSITCNP